MISDADSVIYILIFMVAYIMYVPLNINNGTVPGKGGKVNFN